MFHSKLLGMVVLLAWTASAALPARAAEGTSVAIGGVARNGSILTVSGASAYADQPYLVQGTDAPNDTSQSGPSQLGLDLTGASLATTADGRLSLRWTVNELPPTLNGMPQANYNWTFCINVPDGASEEAGCWWVTASRMNWFIPDPNPWLQVWRCLNTTAYACAENELTDIGGTLVFDGPTKTVTATIALSDLGGEAGLHVAPVVGYSFLNAPVWTAESLWYGFVFRDGVAYDEPYTIPAKQVSLAIGASGQKPEDVVYDTTATTMSGGAYSGDLDISALSAGTYTVYVRACFGVNNCGYATQDVTI